VDDRKRGIVISKKELMEVLRGCDSCEKKYPEKYLTAVRSPLEV
jgi:hypothetical protein